MKKFFLTAILSAAIAVCSFAKDADKISAKAQQTFSNQFNKASNVTWTVSGDVSKATFFENNCKKEAFFDSRGDIMATCTTITLNEIPTRAKRAFAKKYEGYTVTEAIHYTNSDNEVLYFLSANNEKESLILQVDKFDLLSVFQKTRKN